MAVWFKSFGPSTHGRRAHRQGHGLRCRSANQRWQRHHTRLQTTGQIKKPCWKSKKVFASARRAFQKMKAQEQHLGERLRRKVTCDRETNSEHLPGPRAQVWTSQLHPACLWHSATTRCVAPVFTGAFLREGRSVSISDLPVRSQIRKLTDFASNLLEVQLINSKSSILSWI